MNWLFTTAGFLPRAHCGTNWTPLLIAAYIIPNIVIVLAYWWIPINGIYYYGKRHRKGLTDNKGMLWVCLMFVLWCGITHAFDIIVFVHPAYYLNILALNIAAYYSARAAWKTRSYIKDALLLSSRDEIYAALDLAQAERMMKEVALAEQRILIAAQEKNIKRMAEIIETQAWIYDKDKILRELAEMLVKMRA